MATTTYFEETVKCQGGKESLKIELGRSSYFEDDSIYLVVDGKAIVMDLETAKRFVKAVSTVGHYFGFLK